MRYAANKFRTFVIVGLMVPVLIACGGATTGGNATTSAPSSTSGAAAPSSAVPTAVGTTASPTKAQGATASTAASAPAGTTATTAPTGTTATSAISTKLNLNDVTEQQLMATIPNFSSRMVREFMEYRPYISILQFRKEIGKYVSAEQVAAYEQYVYVPVDVDQADAATLQQLPSVDAKIAEQLIAGRPYGSNQAFLSKLDGLTSPEDAQQATVYLTAK